jgi:hypothetical protein
LRYTLVIDEVILFIARKIGIDRKQPRNIVTTHAVPRLAPNIIPVMAGPKTPDTDHCKLIHALARPRICSGESSFARVGIVGACTISPKANTNWLTQIAIPDATIGRYGAIPTKSHEIAQIIPMEISAVYFE